MFERLEVGFGVRSVQGLIPARDGQNALAKHTQLGVDNDMAGLVEPARGAVAKLGAANGRHGKVDGNVDAGAENEAEAGGGVEVSLGEQCGGRVVDNGSQLDVEAAGVAGGLDNVAEVLAQERGARSEAFTHALQFAAFQGGLPEIRRGISIEKRKNSDRWAHYY